MALFQKPQKRGPKPKLHKIINEVEHKYCPKCDQWLPLTNYGKQRKALGMFRELVRRYPNSTRIAESAYYIGDIYKEYFDEDVRAVQWYQRAWEWDPKILKPARFQAAVVYDLLLAQPGKALPLYQAVLKYEQFNGSNVNFATNRIKHLTGAK